MNKLKIYCFVTNESKFLKKLPANIVPVIIGNNNSTTFLSENVGINISNLNKYYAELTGLYWVFKNRIEYHNDDDFVGFCHYRRLWMNGILNKKNIIFEHLFQTTAE